MRALLRLMRTDHGAIAPTVALSLFALIGVGGLAFDYARVATMDTELQQAADQAALAAATQLDRQDGSRDRATAAIQNSTVTSRLASNITRFANDGNDDGTGVEIASITFCKDFDDSEADTAAACDSSGVDDNNATVVVVTTTARTANYAFTPIVAAMSSPQISASAVASIEASVCNVQPLMVCAPNDNWPTDQDIGEGLRMKPGSQAGAWAPGNFGLLDFGNGNPAVINALQGFGLNGCIATDDTATEPGQKEVTDAINTRLDVYDKGNSSVCNTTTGYGCPAASARKDSIADISGKNPPTIQTTTATPPTQAAINTAAAALSCPADPKAAGLVLQNPTSPVQGLGRDTCHYTNTCAGYNIGDKAWNRNAYFQSNYGWDAATWPIQTGLPSNVTRYQVYQWELLDKANRMATKKFASIDPTPKVTGPASNRRYTWTVTAQCSYPTPKYGSTAYPAQKDRRLMTVIAANCDKLTGKGQAFEDFVILRAFDVFLTEPSMQRTYPGATDDKEIYGEIIGPAEPFQGGAGFQYYSRAKPYLIR